MLKPKKKKVNTGNPLLDKAIKSSNARKAAAKKKAAAAKKKANLGPVKGGAATVAGNNPLSYLTKAAANSKSNAAKKKSIKLKAIQKQFAAKPNGEVAYKKMMERTKAEEKRLRDNAKAAQKKISDRKAKVAKRLKNIKKI